MTWATLADVTSVTGVTVDAATLARADGMISIYANRTAITGVGVRDLEWLRVATSWQAAWLPGQPDIETRQAVAEFSQDGIRVIYNGASQAAGMTADWKSTLAPMAARALRNLSWKGSRTLRVPSVNIPLGRADVTVDFTLESSDEAVGDWAPL